MADPVEILEQLWFFWVMPIVGAVLAGLVHYHVIEDRTAAATT